MALSTCCRETQTRKRENILRISCAHPYTRRHAPYVFEIREVPWLVPEVYDDYYYYYYYYYCYYYYCYYYYYYCY